MEKLKNTLGLIILIIILLTFIFGGYFLMRYFTKNEGQKEVVKDDKPKIDLRIDKTKDYLYYDNMEEVLESEEIEFMDVEINISGFEDTNNTLKSEMNTIRKSIKYGKDISNAGELNLNPDDIYSLEYRDYQDYSYNEFLSLLVMDYKYNVVDGSIPTNIESYVINKNTGKRMMGDELLQKYNITMDEIKDKVKNRVSDIKNLNEDISVDDTMNNFNTFALYINKVGKLAITYVVKTSNLSYNDNVVLS